MKGKSPNKTSASSLQRPPVEKELPSARTLRRSERRVTQARVSRGDRIRRAHLQRPGSVVFVHNGKAWMKVKLAPSLVGMYFGERVKTRVSNRNKSKKAMTSKRKG